MRKSSESINISGEDDENLRTCANDYPRAVWQRTFHWETRQCHVPTLSLFLKNKQQDN